MAEGGDAWSAWKHLGATALAVDLLSFLPPHVREAIRGLPARDDTPLPRRARSTNLAYGNGAASPPGERVGAGDAPPVVETNA